MTEESIIRLVLQLRGQEAVKELRASVAQTDASLKKLTESYSAGDVKTDQYLKTSKKLHAEQRTLNSAIEEATRQEEEREQRLIAEFEDWLAAIVRDRDAGPPA